MCMAASTVTHLAGEFDSFVRARTAALLRAAYFLTGDQHLAEDLVQSALARTHRAWSNLHATGAADAYTRKTMYHLQVSWWRRRRVAETLTEDVPTRATTGTDLADSTALQVTLRSVLLRLPPRQRAVLVLRFFDDLTEAQTAEVLGINIGTVKSQTAKALAKLRVLAPELKEFYGGAVGEVRQVDLRDRALASSRRLANRRSAAVSAATAVAAAVAVVLSLFGPWRGRSTPPAEPTPSPSRSAVSAPGPSATPVRKYLDDSLPDLGPFRSVTIEVPPWAGARGALCPSGQVRLDADGTAAGGSLPVWVDSYTEADVDGDGDGDLVAILRCGEGPESPGTEVIAFRRVNGRPVTMGRIVGTRDGFGGIHQVAWTDVGVEVELSEHYADGGKQTVPFQTRTYRFDGTKVRQVAGPTTFETKPRYANLRVDATDLTLRRTADGSYSGHLTVTVANRGDADVRDLELHLRLRGDWLKLAGPGWAMCTREDFAAPTSVHVRCLGPGVPAGAKEVFEFDFVADVLPSDLNPTPDPAWQVPYSVEAEQWLPNTFEQSEQPTVPFAVVVA
ncbi:hypothetical protein GCM10028775_62680 [Catellatospora paridis]